jgi:hypothetical protein
MTGIIVITIKPMQKNIIPAQSGFSVFTQNRLVNSQQKIYGKSIFGYHYI